MYSICVSHMRQEPYSSDAASRALGNQGAYVAAVNMFWMDFLKSPTPGVPLRRKSVEDLADYIWPQGALPSFLLKLLEVQAPASTTVAEVPQGLQMLSPEGYAHAALCACARDLPQHSKDFEIRPLRLCGCTQWRQGRVDSCLEQEECHYSRL